MAHAGGRPPIYKTPEEMQAVIDAYFAECDPHWVQEEYYDFPLLEGEDELEPQGHGGALRRSHKPLRDYNAEQTLQTRWVKTEQIPYTMAGLARRLGMERHALAFYRSKDRFSSTIKEARARVGEYNERMLHQGKNAAGAIFNLKANFEYRDMVEESPPPENPIIFINNVPVIDPKKSS